VGYISGMKSTNTLTEDIMSNTRRKVLAKIATPAPQQHSRYWLDTTIFDSEEDAADAVVDNGPDINKMLRLAAIRRGIANFVQILTQKSLPVVFSSGNNSYTDGQTIVISADEDPSKFDPMVGLALHEASHVLLSDFTFLEHISSLKENISFYSNLWRGKNWHTPVLNSMVHPSVGRVLSLNTVGTEEYIRTAQKMLEDIKDIMNILEDRRIDKYVYQTAQGYRPYYDALYAKYFFTKEIGKSLKFNPDWRKPTVENYINRLLFAFHPDNDPTSMAGLPQLMKLMDINTIERVGEPSAYVEKEVQGYYGKTEVVREYAWQTSISYGDMPALWKEANILYAYILKLATLDAMQQEQEEVKGVAGRPSSINQQLSDLPNMDGMPTRPDEMQDKPVEESPSKSKATPFNEKKANKEIADAKKLMEGEVKRKKVTAAEASAIDSMEQAAAELVDIKGDGVPFGHCIVTRRVTDAVLTAPWFPFGTRSDYKIAENDAAITEGRRMGAILEHRLQVRNDPQMTIQTRLPQGNLDRRLLAQLGMDITSVFNKTRVDQHRPVMLHLTLDASGSMTGKKWYKTTVVATAIAYLSTRMRNVDAVITVRGGSEVPMVAVLFDSRKDSFKHYQRFMRCMSPTSNTPEGLCFKATLDLVLENASTHDVYFINFSDGEPGFGYSSRNTLHKGENHYFNYGGKVAFDHTRSMVNRIRERGVKILSYFIDDRSSYGGAASEKTRAAFKHMYGQDAQFVNVQSATEVLRTLNKLLLTRGA